MSNEMNTSAIDGSENGSGGTKVRFVTVTESSEAQRIDNFLLSNLKGVPKSKIYRIIRKGEVRVNKGRVKPEYKLSIGDVVRVPPVSVREARDSVKPGNNVVKLLQNSIIFENQELLVINKPSGMAVHGGSGINLGVIEAFRAMRPDHDFLELVHRLDRDTSGCLLIAKKRTMLRYLHQCLREDGMKKIYHTVVVGKWPNHVREVNAPLLKNELKSGERVVTVTKEGKPSLTKFRLIERFKGFTLVEASPITGRTHQIRVHAAFAGYPILGDEKYGVDEVNKGMKRLGAKRLMLHAAELAVKLPSDRKVTVFKAPYEQTFHNVVGALREEG
ncbi:23S rRNA pseudouridine(955/2504/2580) synthase RluC [Alkalimarinus coralli]|uniref:23S rRNA pseudouridine(955/2504/2580) synthase RluC n=1 Tax=Alkalimarinus coralli TaxID=2935863 RepID=UPI00202ACF00|nr:23S rRNA pseudouridine(955/2504/2580) synthase RluC [Alkalimarinus coralli]